MRCSIFCSLALTLAALLPTPPAGAELMRIDWRDPGDQLITRDTSSGLDWLRLDVTHETGLSFDEIAADVGGFVSDGWRHATGPEVCSLFAQLGSHPDQCPGGIAGEGLSLEDYFYYLGSFGVQWAHIDGLYDDMDDDLTMVGMAQVTDLGEGWGGVSMQDATIPSGAVSPQFLVRPIPEANAALLVVIGGAIVMVWRRRCGRCL